MQEMLQVSIDMIKPADRMDFWRDITRPLYNCEPSGTSLEGACAVKLIGSMLSVYAQFSPQYFTRDRRTISRSGLEDFYLLQLFTGSDAAVECGGVHVAIERGDVYIADLGRTVKSKYNAGSTYSLFLQRAHVEKVTGHNKLHGTIFRAGKPQTQLLADMIVGVMKLNPAAENLPGSTAEAAIISVLALALQHDTPLGQLHKPALSPILRRRVIDFIAANITEPNLDIKMLMQRFKVSRAHLYRMFEQEGGVVRAISERRMDAVFQCVIDQHTMSVTSLAQNFGFSSSDQLEKKFRRHFGITLNEIKRERAGSIVKDGKLSDMNDYLSQCISNKNYKLQNGLII